MARPAISIHLTSEEKEKLMALADRPKTEQRLAQRAKIILLAAEDHENRIIAKRVGLSVVKVCKWRQRFALFRLEGIQDQPRSGRPPQYNHDQRLQVINQACQPPSPQTHWTARDLAKKLSGTVGMSKSSIALLLKEIDLKPHQMQMWLNSRDPDFAAKEAEVVGLYLNPPENALVISVDEKTGMQALEPIRPTRPMQPGRPEKREFEYKRHGTLSLFAALLVHKGEVIAQTASQHTHAEFLEFLKRLHRQCSKRKHLHLIVDNLATHKHKKVKEWISKHPRVHLHFTPTHASWLNQIELWFSILGRRLLKRGIFKSTEDLAQQVVNFIEDYNQTAKPFAWTYAGKPLKI